MFDIFSNSVIGFTERNFQIKTPVSSPLPETLPYSAHVYTILHNIAETVRLLPRPLPPAAPISCRILDALAAAVLPERREAQADPSCKVAYVPSISHPCPLPSPQFPYLPGSESSRPPHCRIPPSCVRFCTALFPCAMPFLSLFRFATSHSAPPVSDAGCSHNALPIPDAVHIGKAPPIVDAGHTEPIYT